MVAVLIFNLILAKKTTVGKLVTMATEKRLSLIYKLGNFANT